MSHHSHIINWCLELHSSSSSYYSSFYYYYYIASSSHFPAPPIHLHVLVLAGAFPNPFCFSAWLFGFFSGFFSFFHFVLRVYLITFFHVSFVCLFSFSAVYSISSSFIFLSFFISLFLLLLPRFRLPFRIRLLRFLLPLLIIVILVKFSLDI